MDLCGFSRQILLFFFLCISSVRLLSLSTIFFFIENSSYTMMTSNVKRLVWNENKCDSHEYAHATTDGGHTTISVDFRTIYRKNIVCRFHGFDDHSVIGFKISQNTEKLTNFGEIKKIVWNTWSIADSSSVSSNEETHVRTWSKFKINWNSYCQTEKKKKKTKLIIKCLIFSPGMKTSNPILKTELVQIDWITEKIRFNWRRFSGSVLVHSKTCQRHQSLKNSSSKMSLKLIRDYISLFQNWWNILLIKNFFHNLKIIVMKVWSNLWKNSRGTSQTLLTIYSNFSQKKTSSKIIKITK